MRHEVRRADDDELCGYVAGELDCWWALTVFGGRLGEYASRADAADRVRSDGLASLVDRWVLRNRVTAEEDTVCIVEARPGEVVVAMAPYATPDVPRRTLTERDLAETWDLSPT